jgi:hypothetical protein
MRWPGPFATVTVASPNRDWRNCRTVANTWPFIALDQATTTARQLYDAMLDLYPDRVNPGSLWGAANTAKKQT